MSQKNASSTSITLLASGAQESVSRGFQVTSATPTEMISSGLLSCVARWGLSKTTVEDVAKESGVSRATVYRLFPGGKNAIMQAAVLSETSQFLTELIEELSAVDQVEECLTAAIQRSAQFIEQHQALSFMRKFEPALIEQLLSFDQLNLLFATAAQVLRPVLSRFMDEAEAYSVGMWISRLVVSYVGEPSAEFDICERQDAQRLVRLFVIPGLTASLPSDQTTAHFSPITVTTR
ncbi:MAG: TetR/AcrR family transcriptional regulator [Microthrixaceae bacterium]